MKEDYVSFKTAKLLKEKGFDGYCFMTYDICGTLEDAMEYGEVSMCNSDCCEGDIAAPTPQMAMKYLREAHNLHITIKPYITIEGIMYAYEIYKLKRDMVSFVYSKAGFENNESACKDAINICLTDLI